MVISHKDDAAVDHDEYYDDDYDYMTLYDYVSTHTMNSQAVTCSWL